MSRSEDMKNSTNLGDLLGDVNPENTPDRDQIIPMEDDTNLVHVTAVNKSLNEDMFNFITPDEEQFDEMKKSGSAGKISEDPRESYIAFLIDNQNMTLKEATERANQVYPQDVATTVDKPIRRDSNSTADVVVVNVDKTNVNDLEFTEEEKSKLLISKAIRLNVLEDESLRSINVKSQVRGKKKITFLESFANKLNQYSVPMMNTGDFATFRAAKAIDITMAQMPYDSSSNELNSMHDWYNKQATFLYDRFVSSTAFPELEEGEKPSSVQFINHFKYDDMAAALFAISLSTLSSTDKGAFQCRECKHNFEHTYSLEELFNVELRPEGTKTTMNKIKASKYERETMLQFVDKKNEHFRVRSEETGIVYELYLPSIAEMLEMSKSFKGDFNNMDDVLIGKENLAAHIYSIFVPEQDGSMTLIGRDPEFEETHDYPYVGEDYAPTEDILAMIELLPQSDYELLVVYANAMVASFDQLIKVTCPNCGKELYFSDDISRKVFTAARGDRTLRDINPGDLLSL